MYQMLLRFGRLSASFLRPKVVSLGGMGKPLDLRGQIFHRLFALRRVKTEKGPKWFCFCSCGGHTLAPAGSLRKGSKKSCGCLKLEALADARAARARKKIEGGSGSPVRDTQETEEAINHQEAVADAIDSLGIQDLAY